MKKLLLILLLVCGCATPMTTLDIHLPKKERSITAYKTVDSFKKHFFTDKAYEAIKDIPVIDGVNYKPFVSGVNFWSSAMSVLTGNGLGRKVILDTEYLGIVGIKTLLHEYLHHLDDMTRDGEGRFIELDEFAWAYKKLAKDTRYAGIVKYTEDKANNWVTDLFGVGFAAEHIAYSGSHAVLYGAPQYFRWVFRNIFKEWEDAPMPLGFIQ